MKGLLPPALSPYVPIADAIALLFRPHVEVVLHDLETVTIAHIANPLPKRQIGDTSAGERFDDNVLGQDVIGPYRKVGRDGRNLRSITATLRNGGGTAIGMMCINFDVTMLEKIGDQIASLANLPGSLEPHAPFFHDNWRQAIERTIAASEQELGVPAASFGAGDREQVIRALFADGLFNMRNAPAVAARRLGISRTSLYNHLRRIR